MKSIFVLHVWLRALNLFVGSQCILDVALNPTSQLPGQLKTAPFYKLNHSKLTWCENNNIVENSLVLWWSWGVQAFAKRALNLCCQTVHGQDGGQGSVALHRAVGQTLVPQIFNVLSCLVEHVFTLWVLVLQVLELQRENVEQVLCFHSPPDMNHEEERSLCMAFKVKQTISI